eukprot:5052123-Pyramimonas_sp.AAC.1
MSSVTVPGPTSASRGITVFITSISAYGCPGRTVSPSWTRKPTSLPALACAGGATNTRFSGS